LAGQTDGPARHELTNELADLLIDWPETYPSAMREPFEALLEKALRDIEPEARALLAQRFAANATIPLSVINALIFDATSEVRAEILARNSVVPDDIRSHVDEIGLLAHARSTGVAGLVNVVARRLQIGDVIATNILSDASGFMLALLCKGAGMSRAAFSALAVLARPSAPSEEHYRRLAAFDDVPEDSARALLAFWRRQVVPAEPITQAA
jgi:hypothetical protein